MPRLRRLTAEQAATISLLLAGFPEAGVLLTQVQHLRITKRPEETADALVYQLSPCESRSVASRHRGLVPTTGVVVSEGERMGMIYLTAPDGYLRKLFVASFDHRPFELPRSEMVDEVLIQGLEHWQL